MVFQRPHRYEIFNRRIYDLIEKSKKVLDVGCATGKLGEMLKKEKNCFVVGIEIDKDMAEEAKERCDQVIVSDIETLYELPFPHGFFDVIVFADILEHLRHPEEVLRRLKNYVSNDGYILISIPNIAFITIRLGLLFGKFYYGKWGILHERHLRFFVQETAERLMEESGYRIVRFEGYTQVRSRYFLVSLAGKIWKRLFATNFIIEAVKK